MVFASSSKTSSKAGGTLRSKDKHYNMATAISQTAESTLLSQNCRPGTGSSYIVCILTVALSLEVAVAHSES